MLSIRPAQMRVFEEAARRRFEDEMVIHSQEFTPELSETIGEEQLRVALRQAIRRAGDYGFTNRGPVRLYLELTFLHGSDFDTDPQYPTIARILRSPTDQMERADRIYARVLDYQQKVSGPEAMNTRQALVDLLVFAKKPVTFTSSNCVPVLLREMHAIFPQKAAYVGDEGLKALIHAGQTEARKHHLPIRGEALCVTLMFAFGHGCANDPLYPWISRTLRDERIVDGAARAERLEKKAVTWLEHVLASPPTRGQP